MKFEKTLIKELEDKAGLRLSTIDNHLTTMKWFSKQLELDTAGNFNPKELLRKLTDCENLLTAHSNPSVAKVYGQRLYNCLLHSAIPKEKLVHLKETVTTLNKQDNKKRRENPKKRTEEQQEDLSERLNSSLEQLKRARYRSALHYSRYLLLAFMIHLPRRLTCLANTRFTDEPSANWINMETAVYHIRHFKNSKTTGAQKTTIPPQLMAILREYREFHPEANHLFTSFTNDQYKPRSEQTLAKDLQLLKIPPNPVGGGVHLFRSHFITNEWKRIGVTREQIIELLKLQQVVGNSLGCQMTDYLCE